MFKISSITSFLNNNTIQIPAIVPLSGIAGYQICGTKCAGIGVFTSTVDLGLKYFKLSDSYYTTFSILGGAIGYKLSSPFVDKYNKLITNCEPIKSIEGVADLSASINSNTIKVEYLSKILSIGVGAVGILTSNFISKIENWLLGKNNESLFGSVKCERYDENASELVSENNNPEL